jgi:threonine/homoserine/homoserine lactone efflux protein
MTVQRTLIYGALSGVALQLGSIVGGLPYALLTSAGISQVANFQPMHIALGLTGATVLLFLGWSSVRDARRFIERASLRFAELRRGQGGSGSVGADSDRSASLIRASLSPTQRSFLTGILISICNPVAIAFWLGLEGVMTQPPHRNPVLVLTGFYVSLLVWALLLPLVLSRRHHWLNDRLLHTLSLVCGVAQIGFGLHAGYVAVLG